MVFDLAKCIADLGDRFAADVCGVSRDSIEKVVDMYADGNQESLMSKRILLRLYEDCMDLEVRSRLEKFADAVTIRYRTALDKLHLNGKSVEVFSATFLNERDI